MDFVTVIIQSTASPTIHWSLPNQICCYFLEITKLLGRKCLALSLHSGGPKSENHNFEALNISFRNCYKAHMFTLQTKSSMQKVRDHILFLQNKLAKKQSYFLGVHNKKMVNFSTQKNIKQQKYFQTNVRERILYT